MSVEGFLLKRRRFRTTHNMYQLTGDDKHFDLDVAISLLETVGKAAEDGKEMWTIVPPGYKWSVVK